MTRGRVDDQPEEHELSFPLVGPPEHYTRPERFDRVLLVGAVAVVVLVILAGLVWYLVGGPSGLGE